jgi:hypothetical protein
MRKSDLSPREREMMSADATGLICLRYEVEGLEFVFSTEWRPAPKSFCVRRMYFFIDATIWVRGAFIL